MKELLRAEIFKLKKSSFFRVLLFFNALSFVSTAFLALVMSADGNGYKLLLIDLTYVLHHFVVGYLLVAEFVGSEFSNRTFSLGLLGGHARSKLFAAKFIVFCAGFVLLVLEYIFISVITIIFFNGLGLPAAVSSIFKMIKVLLLGVLGYAAAGSVIMLVAVLMKKTVKIIGAGMCLTYGCMWLNTYYRDNPLFIIECLYTNQLDGFLYFDEGFSVVQYVVVMAVTLVVSVLLAGAVFEKGEFK